MKKTVGFDQKILPDYLHYTANEASYTTKKEMYKKLKQYLSGNISGISSRKHVVTLLMKIWYHIPEINKPLQKRALKLLPQLDSQQQNVLHWGMTLLAYPFFKDVAGEIGRLSSRQHDFFVAQIYRKMKEWYGDRRRIEVATQAVLSSMKSWQIIIPKKRGVYVLPEKIKLLDVQIINWLTAVAIISSKKEYIQLSEIPTLSYLFSFIFNINTSILDDNIFEITSQGVDKIMIAVKKTGNSNT